MLIGCKTGTLVFDCETNIQSDTIILNKTDIHRQKEQLNKEVSTIKNL